MHPEDQDIVVMEEEGAKGGADPYTRGWWEGSNVTSAEIDWLYRSRRIPKRVACRLPKNEIEPMPEPGKVFVFTAHFARGLGLPDSTFLCSFLDWYAFQPGMSASRPH
jgi:hypothetical protein